MVTLLAIAFSKQAEHRLNPTPVPPGSSDVRRFPSLSMNELAAKRYFFDFSSLERLMFEGGLPVAVRFRLFFDIRIQKPGMRLKVRMMRLR